MRLLKITILCSVIIYIIFCILASIIIFPFAAMDTYKPSIFDFVKFVLLVAVPYCRPLFLRLFFIITCFFLFIDIIKQIKFLNKAQIQIKPIDLKIKMGMLIVVFMFIIINQLIKVSTGEGKFITIAKMITPRKFYSTVLLDNGEVLVTGGYNKKETTNQAELYNPKTKTFSQTSSMIYPRDFHTSLLLKNGNALILGGMRQIANEPTENVEIYDTKTQKFFQKGKIKYKNIQNKAILLPDGKVFILYSLIKTKSGKSTNLAEIYNPDNGTSKVIGQTILEHQNPTLALMPNNKIFISGGDKTSNAEIYDYNKNKFILTTKPTSISSRKEHLNAISINLNDKKILLIRDSQIDTYDVEKQTFVSSKAKLKGKYQGDNAILLKNGKVLLLPIYTKNYKVNSKVVHETFNDRLALYDPKNDKYNYTKIKTHKHISTAHPTLLKNGDVLITEEDIYDSSAVIYKP